MQVVLHNCPHDGHAETLRVGGVEAGGQAAPVVADGELELRGPTAHGDLDGSLCSGLEGVLEGVVHKLGDRQRQRGGRARVELARSPADSDRDARLIAHQAVPHQVDDRGRDLREVDPLFGRVSEQIVYDRETGQMLTASFMDYQMPRADDLPAFQLVTREVPTKVNPLGAKGVG